MLKLPKDWQTFSGGKLAEVLLAQLSGLPVQTEFLRGLVAAALDPTLDQRAENPGSCLRELLDRYNRLVVDRGGDDRLLVAIPPPTVYRTVDLRVPTYDPDGAIEYDYNRTENLTLQELDGLRAVMGNPADPDSPDVLIERAVGLWRVFVHPNNGDPLCIIEIRSDRATIETDRGELLLERQLP
jgi:hypothetical protein